MVRKIKDMIHDARWGNCKLNMDEAVIAEGAFLVSSDETDTSSAAIFICLSINGDIEEVNDEDTVFIDIVAKMTPEQAVLFADSLKRFALNLNKGVH